MNKKNRTEFEITALVSSFDFLDKSNDKNNPFIKFSTLLNSFSSRLKIIEDTMTKVGCKNTYSADSAANFLDHGICIVAYAPEPDKLNRPVPQFKKYWPQELKKMGLPDEKYEDQVAALSDAFKTVINLILQSLFNKLSDSEKNFISNAKVRKTTAFIRHTPISKIAPVQLFSAFLNEEERIYGLRIDGTNNTLIRIDKDEDKYHDLLASTEKSKNLNLDFLLRPDGPVLKNRDDPLENLVENIVNYNRDIFYNDLYKSGWEETTGENIISFLTSQIPFYDFIQCCIKNKYSEAMFNLGLDLVSLVPSMKQLAKMSLKLGSTIGSIKAITNRAAQHSLRKTLIKKGTSFTSQILYSAAEAFNKKDLASLFIKTVEGLDPGLLTLRGIIGKIKFKQVQELGSHMTESIPDLKKFLKKINNKNLSDKLPNEVLPDRHARLLGSDIEVPLKKISNKYENQDVYVRVDPETGELFGQLYLCTNDKIKRVKRGANLSCIPVPNRNTGAIPRNPQLRRIETKTTEVTRDQQKIIENFSLSKEIRNSIVENGGDIAMTHNLNKEAYGHGIVYNVFVNKNSPTVDYKVVEIQGDYLVPVKEIEIEGHGIKYELYNRKYPEKSYPLIYEGDAWKF